MLVRRYEFYVLVARTISHSIAVLTREILFLPLEHKIHIFSSSCNILYNLFCFVLNVKLLCEDKRLFLRESSFNMTKGGRRYSGEVQKFV